MNRIARFDMAARRIDKDPDVVVAGSGERRQLRADLVRQFLGDAAIDEDRARFEQVGFRFLAQRQFCRLVVVVAHEPSPCGSYACQIVRSGPRNNGGNPKRALKQTDGAAFSRCARPDVRLARPVLDQTGQTIRRKPVRFRRQPCRRPARAADGGRRRDGCGVAWPAGRHSGWRRPLPDDAGCRRACRPAGLQAARPWPGFPPRPWPWAGLRPWPCGFAPCGRAPCLGRWVLLSGAKSPSGSASAST